MNKPFFSIVLPTFNRETLLGRSIGSVINQDFQDWELIIVDDGSTDNSRQLISHFNETRIRYHYQENAERSAARNKGIDLAKGTWICFLDSDDEFLPHHLSALKKEIDSDSEPKLLLTGHIINRDGHESKHPLISEDREVINEISEKFILMNSVCVHISILYNNRFDTRFRLWEDTHLWLRIAAQFSVKQLKEFTAVQHVHSGGTVLVGMKTVRIKDVLHYLEAIDDLKLNCKELFNHRIALSFFDQYKVSKLHMYLYQARQNRQGSTALRIWWKALILNPSWYLMTEFPKIFLNRLFIGIHG